MRKLIIVLIAGLTLLGCKNQNKPIIPSPRFASYIEAYTGGVISTSGTIRIELTRPQNGIELNTPVKENLFSFSPSIKGEAYWVSSNVIEFVPKEGSLKSDKLYTAEFKLGKLGKVEKDLEKFIFSFRTKGQDFAVDILPGVVGISNPAIMKLQGELTFSDVVDAEDAAGMLSLEDQKITSIEPSSGSSSSFKFTFEGIERKEHEEELTLKVNGKPVGIDRQEERTVVVPAIGEFKFMDVRLIASPENGVCVTFSDPLAEEQDLYGFISVSDVGNYVYQIEDNKVNIFFERPTGSTITISVDENIRSANDKTLGQSTEVTLDMEALKPQVQITSQGNIMPDAKNLLLTFRTSNLKAVDLKIIRIYQNNVLMFLQSNTLNTSSELRRSARLVYNKTLYLTSVGNFDEAGWQDYSVDLAPIIKQEPGAIYRIELSPRFEYSTYPCGQKTQMQSAQNPGMIHLTPETLNEEEESQWDTPSTYYWEDGEEGYDWDVYNWQDRDDPCTPSYYMTSERKASCNVMASNLGVIVKSGAERKAWIAVTDILTTAPQEGVEIKIYNFQLQLIGQGKTDKQGMVQIDVKGVGFVAVAQKDGWRTYVKMVEGDQNSLSRFDVGGKQIQKGLKGLIYGERGVWRPGDTLHLTFLMEDRLKKIPDNHPVSIEVFNPRGQFHTRQVNARGTGGFYCFDIPTSDSDPTGTWNAYIKVGGSTFHKSLRIETIKPNRLKINFKLPSDRIDASQRSVQASITASWLTGATARNMKATVEMSLVKGSSSPFKGYERYNFNNPATSFTTEKLDVYNGYLDGEGKATVNISSPSLSSAPGMLRADVVCRVFEPGGDASIYVESFPFSSFSRYVGIDLMQSEGEYFETDKQNSFDVVTLSPSGAVIDSHLEYRIYKLRWSWWWQKGEESLESYVNGNYAEPVDQGTINTSMGRGKLNFRIDHPEWGRFLIYIVDKTSGHATGGIIYMDWPSSYGRAMRSDPDGASMLTFTTDKKSYEVGQEVTVVIPSASGRALVSLENGSTVLGSKWVEMGKNPDTEYKFKVTADMAPNFYIHISLLQPHGQSENSLPIRLYGIQPVEVNSKASHLEPIITAPDVLRPQTDFTVKVNEKTGRQMTYTLAVVDEGLLDLTNFKTPDPWKEFFSREALGVRTWDMFDYVMGAYGGSMGALLSIGGDEQLKPSDRKANRFKPVVKFLGPFTLKKGASNSHKISLPMYVGSVRIMVVAGADEAYGCAQKSIPVRTPLMVLSTLPRTVSVGEDILLPVNIFAMEKDVRDVVVKVETKGGVSLEKDKTLSARFTAPGDQMLYFRLKASELGVANVKITATSGSHTSTDQIQIEVRNPNPMVISVRDTTLRSEESIVLPYALSGKPDALNNVTIEVARMPTVDLTRSYDFLDNYEHLCSEQLTSRGFPMLYLAQFREVDQKEAEKIKKGVESIIKLLYGRQSSDGGFIYWPGDAQANEWITSYTGNFLMEASERGYDVNKGVINRWKDFQRRAAQKWSMPRERERQYYAYYQTDLVQAYRLYTLALAGSAELGVMNRMKEMNDISVAARWRLATAYAISGKKSVASEITSNMRSTVEPYAYGHGYTYGSSERDDAMILETMVLMGNIPEAMRQARRIAVQLTSQNYLSTQSTAFSLVAMGALASKIETGQIEYSWTLDGRAQKDVVSAKAVHQNALPLNKTSGDVVLKSRSKGDLYVTLITKTRPLVDLQPAMSNKIAIGVKYADMSGNPIAVDSLRQGVDFTATVTVSNTGGATIYRDLALTHILPSGWEIFNERMAVSDQTAQEESESESESENEQAVSSRKADKGYNYQDIRDDRVLTYFDLGSGQSKSFTVRLQASYVGRFILPAVLCEAMYDPTSRSRTTAGWTIVK